MRVLAAGLLTLVTIAGAWAQTKSPAPKSAEPITIEFGNMKSEKPGLLRTAEYLKSQGEYRDTASYASQYSVMMRTLNTVGVANLSQAENDLILSVPEPSEAAVAAHEDHKKAAAKKIDAKAEAAQKWIANEELKKRKAAELEEEKRQADLKAQQEQEKINAMNRQAAAQERTARSQEQTARNIERQTQVNEALAVRMSRY